MPNIHSRARPPPSLWIAPRHFTAFWLGQAIKFESTEEKIMSNQRFIEIDGVQVAVTEQVYRAYKRPVWAERKRKERDGRCHHWGGASDDGKQYRHKSGFRCEGDCSKCEKTKTGSILSLDKFLEENYEPEDPADLAEMVAEKMLLSELLTALDELEPGERSLIHALYYEDRTERDYGAKIGLTHQGVHKQKLKIVQKLRELMGSEE